MKLYDIIMATAMQQTITVYHYLTGEVLIDCETVHNILGSRCFIQELQNLQVYKLDIDKDCCTLIVHICK